MLVLVFVSERGVIFFDYFMLLPAQRSRSRELAII